MKMCHMKTILQVRLKKNDTLSLHDCELLIKKLFLKKVVQSKTVKALFWQYTVRKISLIFNVLQNCLF